MHMHHQIFKSTVALVTSKFINAQVWREFSLRCSDLNKMSIKRGAFIVLEGVDRSGKSTQCRNLVESLNKNNIPAELMVFPDRTTLTGNLISQYLRNSDCKLHDKAVHLLFAANRWENVGKIERLLFDGVTVIVDRYSYSGIAYSASKAGMDMEWCKTQEIGLPKPDKVFLLTLNQEEMEKRPGFGTERYENQAMQNKVLEIFKMLVDCTWETIDASGSIDSVHNILLNKVEKIVKDVGNMDLKTLKFEKRILKEKDTNLMLM